MTTFLHAILTTLTPRTDSYIINIEYKIVISLAVILSYFYNSLYVLQPNTDSYTLGFSASLLGMVPFLWLGKWLLRRAGKMEKGEEDEEGSVCGGIEDGTVEWALRAGQSVAEEGIETKARDRSGSRGFSGSNAGGD